MSVKKIDITSDVNCPFCLIGVKQILNATEKYKAKHPSSPDFQIRLLPYRLDPNLTPEPKSREEYYRKRFGDAKAEMIFKTMGPKLESMGFKADFGGTLSSTHLAHRLQTYALLTKPNNQVPLAMDVFEGFHGYKKDPSDKQWLSQLATKHEIFQTEKEALDWLNGNECDEEVTKGYLIAQRLGVTGVPFFVFQDKYAASGAMGEEELLKLLEEIDQRESTPTQGSNGLLAQGDSCAPICSVHGETCKIAHEA
ncbi:uncharacterized protein IL334_006391 [Kwoniella shivajii]|uniref:DSBA-like thioredoxin domain-containing protein n=1 Tax=Kwoniella shivajii TaxID=564305 RepID=A0ABZ1D6E6_9TREE|nr:hypothetical protein IL334_006391 [Kwoniella shivajii]